MTYKCQLGFCLAPDLKVYLERLCYGIPHMQWHPQDRFFLTIRHFHLNSYEELDQLSYQLEALAQIKSPVKFRLKSITPLRLRHLYKLVVSIEPLDSFLLKDYDTLLIQAKCQLSQRIEPQIELSSFSTLQPDRLAAYLENHMDLSPSNWFSNTLYLEGLHQEASSAFYREILLST